VHSSSLNTVLECGKSRAKRPNSRWCAHLRVGGPVKLLSKIKLEAGSCRSKRHRGGGSDSSSDSDTSSDSGSDR
jgi:hypothetical protein